MIKLTKCLEAWSPSNPIVELHLEMKTLKNSLSAPLCPNIHLLSIFFARTTHIILVPHDLARTTHIILVPHDLVDYEPNLLRPLSHLHPTGLASEHEPVLWFSCHGSTNKQIAIV
jgi:hypothetical protein